MKVHRLLADTLAAHEITTMFGLLGDGNMLYVADYVDAGHGRFVGTVHESGATSMADGFFRFSGRLELVAGVLADRVQHREPRLGVVCCRMVWSE